MATLNGIKLIIWDLDETLWQGTISEETVQVKLEVREFLEQTLNAGIVHSICSKNDFKKTKEELERLELWQYFVFPSIDWSPKGERVKAIISDMKIRPVNTLFIDDDSQNLKEVEYYCDGIHVELPACIHELLEEARVIKKNDYRRKRLAQYRVLEKKREARYEFSTNQEFLMASDIRVEIHHDCLSQIDRLHELLMRSNQLNYTKFRQPKDELIQLLQENGVQSGYVTVMDKFGDYGIVGFFVLKDNMAIHYLFSCRTLGMLVEQWVFKTIGCPKITVEGEVITKLNNYDLPEWINQIETSSKKVTKARVKEKVLFKGPCDMLQMFAFINNTENIDTEFTYTNDKGVVVEGINHSAQILSSVSCSREEKNSVLSNLSWSDSEMFNTKWSTGKYDAIYYSMVTDAAMGCYRHKQTGLVLSVCERFYDITDKKNWDGLISGKIYGENIKFNIEMLEYFSREFECIHDNDFSQTMVNIDRLWRLLPSSTDLHLLLGTEISYEKEKRPAYMRRAEEHKILNNKIKEWAKGKENVFILEIGKYVKGQGDYINSINHFTKKVYYQLAKVIVCEMEGASIAGKTKIYREEALATIKRIGRRLLRKE